MAQTGKASRTYAEELWPYEQLPQWNPEAMFQLFLRHRDPSSPPTREESDLFAKMLMHKTALSFAQHKCKDALDRGPGAADVANKIVWFIMQRCDRFQCRVPWEELPPGEGYLALIASLNTAIFRKISEELSTAHRRVDAFVDMDSADEMDGVVAGAVNPALGALEQVLTEEQMVDRLCAGAHGDIDDLVELVGTQTQALLQRNTLVPFRDLPPMIRKRINAGTHALITSRVNRAARVYAADQI